MEAILFKFLTEFGVDWCGGVLPKLYAGDPWSCHKNPEGTGGKTKENM